MICFCAFVGTSTFCKVDMQEEHFNRNGLIVIEIVGQCSRAIIPRSHLTSESALVPTSGMVRPVELVPVKFSIFS